jgi:hypothetical protein
MPDYIRFSVFSYDVRGGPPGGSGSGIPESGRHWNDGVRLGARARFDPRARPDPVLWIEDLREADRGTYKCRVDFRQAPARTVKVTLDVIGEYRCWIGYGKLFGTLTTHIK